MTKLRIVPNFKEVLMRSRLQKDVCRMVFVCVMLVMGLVLATQPTPVKGQEATYPSKPIEVIVPFTPGGSVAMASQHFADALSQELKVPFVVIPRPGGGGVIASNDFVHNTKPDGYTLLGTAPGAIIPSVLLSKNPPFDVKKDFLPVGYLGDTSIAIAVQGNSPFKTIQDMIQFAKSNPGKLRGGVSGPGSETDLMFYAFYSDAKIDGKRVPYNTGTQAKTALMGGHIDWTISSYMGLMPYVESRDMRILLATRKLPELPDVPTGRDIGLPNFTINIWAGYFAHAKTPKGAYDKLVAAITKVSRNPDLPQKFTKIGFDYKFKNPQEMADIVDNDIATFARIIKAVGLKEAK
jgi:tripartite-type tricarboxylate transporter receptor subunit TctC